MSWLDTVKGLFAPERSSSHAVHHALGEAGEVLRALREVIDPETHIDVVRMGMVRAIVIEDNVAHVVLTPTTAGCPLSAWLVGACATAIEELGFEADVQIVTDPPWSPEDMDRG
ncbi:MAG: metal-sulfur cluster assembly factor [Pseudomonadota bacterium]|nr:metal-sulfur cluster assembly factor [Pseudomonadota bacterium]